MTKNEALIECLKGKKVYPVGKEESVYIYWDGLKFMSRDTYCPVVADFSLDGYKNADWRIVTELVSFDEAIKAWEQGKTILCNGYSSLHKKESYAKRNCENPAFNASEVLSQWQIIDD